MTHAGSVVMALGWVVALTTVAGAQQPRQNLSPEERARRQAEQERRYQEEIRSPRPIEALNSVWIEELTWMEVRDAIAAGKTMAIVPTGGVEPNGPYVATGKHNYVLQGMCEALARRLGNALCAPIVKFVPEGVLDPPSGHMRFPGTISLRAETYEALLDDIGSSLKAHGFKHIIYIGDSGGNQNGMASVAQRQNGRWGQQIAHHIPEFYNYDDVLEYMQQRLGVVHTTEDGFHDNFYITSIMMAVDPTVVRYDQRVRAGKATINGVSIVPKERAIEVGKKLIEFRVDATVKAISAALAAATNGR